jgi:hypothetical protein
MSPKLGGELDSILVVTNGSPSGMHFWEQCEQWEKWGQ